MLDRGGGHARRRQPADRVHPHGQWWTDPTIEALDVEGDGFAELVVTGAYEDAGAEQFLSVPRATLIVWPDAPSERLACETERPLLADAAQDRILLVSDSEYYATGRTFRLDRTLIAAPSRFTIDERWLLPDGTAVNHVRRGSWTREVLRPDCDATAGPAAVFAEPD